MTDKDHSPIVTTPGGRPRLPLLAGVVLLLAGAAFGAVRWLADDGGSDVPPGVHLYQPTTVLMDFKLHDHTGLAMTPERLKGRWWFLFFGYTSCPDVCASSMLQLSAVNRAIGLNELNGAKPGFLFVSVDPKRDDIARLTGYVSHFGPAFVGATGEADQIAVLERQLDAFHRYGKPNAEGYYTVKHSSYAYLVDPQGRVSARFEPPFDPIAVARVYADLAQPGGGHG